MRNYYQEGYDIGYKDGLAGKENECADFIYRLMDILNDDSQDKWEEGYRDGHTAGHEEYLSNR